ncbi:uncharacterized protein [Haliotis asinina]|uniref:uncharacterized protein n=1 Tax=Haliotis asinina TaxID=109174 RepID=UPI003531E827
MTSFSKLPKGGSIIFGIDENEEKQRLSAHDGYDYMKLKVTGLNVSSEELGDVPKKLKELIEKEIVISPTSQDNQRKLPWEYPSLVTWPSNDPFLPKMRHKDGSLRNIRECFISTGLAVWPHSKSSLYQKRLRDRLDTTFYNHNDTVGLLYMSDSLAELLKTENISDVKIPSDLLFEALYVSSSQALTLLCVVEHKHDKMEEKQNYILQLTRKVTKRVRQFTDEHISCIYGLLDGDELQDDDSFHKCLLCMEEKARAYNNPASLKMTRHKCEKVLNALIAAVGTRQVVLDEREEELWLTEEEFYKRIKTTEGTHERTEEEVMRTLTATDTKSSVNGDNVNTKLNLVEDRRKYRTEFEMVNALQKKTSRQLARLYELNSETQACRAKEESKETNPRCSRIQEIKICTMQEITPSKWTPTTERRLSIDTRVLTFSTLSNFDDADIQDGSAHPSKTIAWVVI